MVTQFLEMAPDTSPIFTTTVVIAGISIVVAVLVLLIIIFELFGKIVPLIVVASEKRAKKKAEKKAKKKAKKNGTTVETEKPKASGNIPMPRVPSVPKTPVQPVVEDGISGEIVAAITAAVVASEGPTAVIRSIQKKNVGSRNPWASAATYDNTRPF